jgi:hypothetical protein
VDRKIETVDVSAKEVQWVVSKKDAVLGCRWLRVFTGRLL